MLKINKILIGTHNDGKFKEICDLLPKKIIKISPKDLNLIFNQKLSENILLDVRTKEECSESKIPGSLNIDYYSENFKNNLDKLNKNLNYYIYCRSGNRSGKTVVILREKGFKNVFNLEGGIIAWKKENYITN